MQDNPIQDELVAFTQALIREESLSGQEGGAANLVREKLLSMDFDEVWVDEYGSVGASRQGKKTGPRLLFDAHLDTVPVQNPEAWQCDPFGGELRDGKIWGRGATDVKGGLAAMVFALSSLPRNSLAGTLILSASVGEEQMEGAALSRVIERAQPDFTLICEPTQCQLGIGQKGRAEFWIDFSGKPAHTSRPELGENAIYLAMEAIQRLRDLALPLDLELGTGVMELVEIRSRPYPGECTVPYGCRLRYDRRLTGGESQATILEGIRAALAGLPHWQCGFQTGSFRTYTGMELQQEHFYPAWSMAPGSAWLQAARLGLDQAGIRPDTFFAPYCTNGSYSAGVAGIPTLIFGPSTIELAHQVDEFIPVEQLMRGYRGMRGLVAGLIGKE